MDEKFASELAYKNGYEQGVKDFAERLKEKAKNNEWNGTICGADIDNLVKEMTEKGR